MLHPQTEIFINVCVKRRHVPKNDPDANPSCGVRGGRALARQIQKAITKADLPAQVRRVDCFGMGCETGPNMQIQPTGQFFDRAGTPDFPEIIAALQETVKWALLAETETGAE